MKRIGRIRRFVEYVMFGLILVTGSNCNGPSPQRLGTIVAALKTADKAYEVDGQLLLEKQEDPKYSRQINLSGEASSVRVDVPAGAYTPSLKSLKVFKVVADSRRELSHKVTGVEFSPTPVTVVADMTTTLTITVKLDDGTRVVFGAGQTEIKTSVDDTRLSCNGCAAGETCLEEQDGSHICAKTCDPNASVESQCGAGYECSVKYFVVDQNGSQVPLGLCKLLPNTPAGTDVAAPPSPDGKLQATFSTVQTAGDTTTTVSSDCAAPPAGLVGGSACYEVVSTTVFDKAEICVDTDGPAHALGHFSSGAWQNITDQAKTTTTRICGMTSSLSPFMVFQLAAPAPAPDANLIACLKYCDDRYGISCWDWASIGACNDFRDRCEAECEPRPQPQNTLRFKTTVGGTTGITWHFEGHAACTSNPFAGSRKKGLRVSFSSSEVSGTTQGPWSLPFGNSFELECHENQDVRFEFHPTESGVFTQPLYKWEVKNGGNINGETFTLVGEAVAPSP